MLHYEKVGAIFAAADVVDGDDAGVLELSKTSSLAGKAQDVLRVIGVLEALNGYESADVVVANELDLPSAALTERRQVIEPLCLPVYRD